MICQTGHIIVWVQLTPSRVHSEEAGAGAGAGAGVNIRARDDYNWVRCLNIDTSHVFEFSAKPYKWIRFVTGAIMGTEGILCDSDDADAPAIDYDRPLNPGNSSVYFRITPAELPMIFPLDPDLADPYRSSPSFWSSSGSKRSTRCNEFRDDIINRDGQCVASWTTVRFCDAVHLITHAKGDAYIKALTESRSRAPNENDRIDDMDDVRNGLLLNGTLHRILALREAAFLLTPNFAMLTSDLDPSRGPDEMRWTTHDFHGVRCPDTGGTIRSFSAPHNRPLHVPTTLGDWPPRIIFDIVYASAVYKYYHHEEFANILLTHWRNGIYLDGNMHVDGDMAEINRRKAALREKKAEKDLKRQEQRANLQRNSCDETEEMDVFDILLAATSMTRPQPTKEQLEAQKKRQEELRVAEQKNLQDNVTAWLRNTQT